MKRIFSTLLLLMVFAVAHGQTAADTTGEPQDTIYLYDSWDSILNGKAKYAFSGPLVYPDSPCEIEVHTFDRDAQVAVDLGSIAMTVGDTLWMANSIYLLSQFESDYQEFSHYIPLYFSRKIAFVQFWQDHPVEQGIRTYTGPDGEEYYDRVDLHDGEMTYYVLDFANKTINRLDHKLLARLLEPYPRLRLRYTGMKHYKHADVIDYFFQEYIKAVDADPEVPEITQVLSKSGK